MKWFWTSYIHSLFPHWGPDSEAPENGYKWLVWLPLAKNIGPKKHSTMFRTKVTISCLKVVLGLLQHRGPVLDLQNLESRSIWGSWNWSEMIPPTPKHWYDTKIMSQARSEPKLQFHSMRLFWASYRPSTLQIDLRLLKIVSNDSPYPKTYQNCFSSIIRTNSKCPCICLLLCGLPVYR